MLKFEKNISRRGLLISIIAALLLAGFAVTNTLSFYYLKNTLKNSIIETELPKAQVEALSDITQSIIPAVVSSSMLANDRYIHQWILKGEKNPDEMTNYLAEVKANTGTSIAFLVSDTTKQYYNSEGIVVYEEKGDPMAQWYYDFIESEKTHDLIPGANIDKDQTPSLFIDYRVRYQDKNIGVVGLGMELSVINDILEKYKNRYNQNIYFLNTSGNILSHSEGAALQQEDLTKVAGLSSSLASNPNSDTELFFEYDSDDKSYLLNLSFLPQLNWWMLIEHEENLIFKEISKTLYTNVIISFITIFVTLLVVGWVVNHFHKRLEILATTDPLTGLDNRQAFEYKVNQALMQSQRTTTPVSMLILDIDKFKGVNDTHGHLLGDQVLKKVASILKSSIRKADCAGRWGGEEFVIMAYGCCTQNATDIAESIRKKVEECAAFPEQVTVSIGIAQADKNDDLDSVLDRADTALYQAKNDGRNCTRTL